MKPNTIDSDEKRRVVTEWSRLVKWQLVGYRVEVVRTQGVTARIAPRHVDVLAPFKEDRYIGAGVAPDEVAKTQSPTLGGFFGGTRKVGKEELADFLEAMGSALEAGASEADGLKLSATSCRSPRLRGIVSGLYLMVNRGVPLSDAMTIFPDSFSPMIIALTRASEAAGGDTKGAIFTKLARRLHNDNKQMRKFIGSMIYPIAVLLFAVAVSIVLQIKALPPMVETFKEMGATIPGVTQFFFDVATIMKNQWFFILAGLVVGLFLLFKFAGPVSRTPLMQRLLLRLPFCGSIIRGMCMSRALNAYCMLKNAGASDLEIYSLAGAAAGNLVFKEMFAGVYRRVTSGEPPEDAFMRERHRIPGDEALRVASKLKVGSFSGDTVPLLERTADDLQDRTDARLALLPQALELPLLAICGAIVGTIILAIFLPYPSLIIDVLNKANKQN